MLLETLVAGVTLLALVAYGVLAGADFGGGVWDLFAGGSRKDAQRTAIAHAMAPVWEANHVWLIFVIVLLFTAFPRGFSSLSIGLFIPLHWVLVGIILRGAAFVFRAYGPSDRRATQRWGAIFGAASVVTPVLLGVSLGAVSSGSFRVRDGEVLASDTIPWLSPIALVIGAFALATCAYLAAVYLTNETEGELREDFRTRALWSGTAVVALSVLALPLLYFQTPHLWNGLTSLRALPVVIPGLVSALLSGFALRIRRFRLARIAAIAQVALLLSGWALAQYPYLIYPDVLLHDAAAPEPTLRFVLWTLPPGALLLGPSLWFLFRIFKRAEHPSQ